MFQGRLRTLILWGFATVGFVVGTVNTLVLIGKVPAPLLGVFGRHRLSEDPIPWAVMNRERIKAEADVFKKLVNFVDSCNKSLRQEILSREAVLRAEHEEINRLESIQKKPTQALEDKKQAFKKKVAELEQLVQKKKDAFDKVIEQCTKLIEEQSNSIIESIAERHQTRVIIESGMAVYSEGVDLTDMVIEELNKKMRNFALPVPEES